MRNALIATWTREHLYAVINPCLAALAARDSAMLAETLQSA